MAPKAAECLQLAQPLKLYPTLEGRAWYLRILARANTDAYVDGMADQNPKVSAAQVGQSFFDYFQSNLETFLTPESLAQVSIADLRATFDDLFGIASIAAMTVPSHEPVKALAEIFHQLDLRKATQPDDAAKTAEALTLYRETGTATAQWTDAAYLDPSGENDWTLQEATLQSGPQIIVAVYAYCEFARGAMSFISADPSLLSVFSKNSLVIASSTMSSRSGILDWNSHFPTIPLHQAYSTYGWYLRGVDTYSSPRFYFLKDGKVVTSFFGFEGGASFRARLLDGMSQIGLKL